MKPKANILIRMGIAELGIKNWQAGAILGISETEFSKLLSRQMENCQQIEMLERIKEGAKKYAEQ